MTLVVAKADGCDTFACDTPLDVIHTLVALGDRVTHAFLPDSGWSEGLREFLEDEYPHVERLSVFGLSAA